MAVVKFHPVTQGVSYDGRQAVGAPTLDLLKSKVISIPTGSHTPGQYIGQVLMPAGARTFRIRALQGAVYLKAVVGLKENENAPAVAQDALATDEDRAGTYYMAEGELHDLTLVDPAIWRGVDGDGGKATPVVAIAAFHAG